MTLLPNGGLDGARVDVVQAGTGVEITKPNCRQIGAGGFVNKRLDLIHNTWFNFFNLGNFIRFKGGIVVTSAAVNVIYTMHLSSTWPTPDANKRARIRLVRALITDPMTVFCEVYQGYFWAGNSQTIPAAPGPVLFDVNMYQPGTLQPFNANLNGGATMNLFEYPVSDLVDKPIMLCIENLSPLTVCTTCWNYGQYTNADTTNPSPSQKIPWVGVIS